MKHSENIFCISVKKQLTSEANRDNNGILIGVFFRLYENNVIMEKHELLLRQLIYFSPSLSKEIRAINFFDLSIFVFLFLFPAWLTVDGPSPSEHDLVGREIVLQNKNNRLYWKESKLEIEAESMREFRKLLNDRNNYTTWLEKCIIASPLENYSDADTIGYFGLLYDSPIVKTYAICTTELKQINASRMELHMKKIDAAQPLRDKWKQIVKSAQKSGATEISQFEAIWTFSQKSAQKFEVTLKVGVEPPYKNIVSIFPIVKGVFSRFVDDVSHNTLQNMKEKIEAL